MNNPFGNMLNTPSPEYKASLPSRIIVGTLLIAVIVPAIIVGKWLFLFVVAAFLAIAVLEVIKAPGKKYGWWVYAAAFIVTFSYVYWFIIKGNVRAYLISLEDGTPFAFSLENYFSSLDISIIGIGASLLVFCLIGLLDKDFSFGDISYFFSFTILLGLGFQSFYFLRYHPFFLVSSDQSPYLSFVWINGLAGGALLSDGLFDYLVSAELLLFMALGAILNDTLAYFGGTYFGKRKLNERVSPHKTWAGFWWGLLVSFAFELIVGLALAAAGYPILPSLTLDKWYWLVLLALAIPLFGDLGDLSLSLIKRYLGIKDYGKILQGHGGVLDRFDSAMFASIGVTILLVFINNDWNIFI